MHGSLALFFCALALDTVAKHMDKPCPFRAFQTHQTLDGERKMFIPGLSVLKRHVRVRLTQVFDLALKKNAPPWASLPSLEELLCL